MVKKFYRIALRFTNNIESLFFDGLGFKYAKQKMAVKQSVVKSSTFQVSLQILATKAFSTKVQYRVLSARTKEIKLFDGQQTVSYPLHDWFDLYYFETFQHFHLNVSVLHFQFKGDEIPECQFGGVTFYDSQIQTQLLRHEKTLRPSTYPKVITSMCDPSLSNPGMLQKVFSASWTLQSIHIQITAS